MYKERNKAQMLNNISSKEGRKVRHENSQPKYSTEDIVSEGATTWKLGNPSNNHPPDPQGREGPHYGPTFDGYLVSFLNFPTRFPCSTSLLSFHQFSSPVARRFRDSRLRSEFGSSYTDRRLGFVIQGCV
jgi:hypothetical protein